MITVMLEPVALALRCAALLPSVWRNSARSGNALFNPSSISVITSGSAFSLIVTPAVVWRQ